MSARVKSRVTVREEKAMGAIDMNRMLTAGAGAGFVYALCRLMQVGILMIPAMLFSFFFFVWLTGKRGGIPRYYVFLYRWQAKVMIAARRKPESLSGRFVDAVGIDISDVIVNGDDIFTSTLGASVEEDMSGLEILETDSIHAGGFEIVSDEELFIEIDRSDVIRANH